MESAPVIAILAKQSVARLRDMDRQIGEQISDLQVQHAWVQRALAEKGAPLTTTPAAPPASNGAGERPKRKRSNKRTAILELMQSEPAGRVWLPSEIRDRLLQDGIDSSIEAVRVTLRRMGDSEGLQRPEDGNGWMLPAPASDPSPREEPNTLRLEGDSPPVSGARS